MKKKSAKPNNTKKKVNKTRSKQKAPRELQLSQSDIDTVKGMLNWDETESIELLMAFSGSVDTAINAVFDGIFHSLILFLVFVVALLNN